MVDQIEEIFAIGAADLDEFLWGLGSCFSWISLLCLGVEEAVLGRERATVREVGREGKGRGGGTWYGWTTEQTRQARRWRHWLEGTKLDADIFKNYQRLEYPSPTSVRFGRCSFGPRESLAEGR